MVKRTGRMACIRIFYLILVLAAATFAAEPQNTGDYIHYRLGVKYKNEKKYDRAIDEFRKVLSAYPDNYNAYFHMAQIREEQQKERLVIYNLKKALSYNPGWSRAQKMLASAYEKDGQYQKAILELQQYQQVSDPAERDSIQRQIDRLIERVNVGSRKAGERTKDGGDIAAAEASVSTASIAVDDKGKEGAKAGAKTGAKTEKRSVTDGAKPSGSGSDQAASVVEQFSRAVDLYNNEKFDEALQGMRQVIARQPGHAGAYYYAGLIRYRNKQYSHATINLAKGIAYPALGNNAHFYLGKIYGEEKKYAKAIDHLFKYIAATSYEPGKKEAQELIDSYRRLGGSAVLDAVAPTFSTGTPGAADTATPREQYLTLEVRIDSLLAMMTVDTLTDAGRKLLAGIRAFTAGRYDDAIIEFRKVLAENPSGTVAAHCLYNTGICYLKLRLFKEAENQFQQVLDRYSGQEVASRSLFFKGVANLERSESTAAEKIFRRFIREHGDHEWTGNCWEKLGDAYVDLEQHKKAVDAYSQAVASSSRPYDKVAVLFKQGKAFLEIGNGTRAIECFERAIDVGEKGGVFIRVPDSYYRIADELYKSKDYKRALEYYTEVTRKYPAFQETPWGLFQIGGIYKNLKRHKEAIDCFKDLIRRFPDDYWARQAQWKMEDAVWEHEYRAVLR